MSPADILLKSGSLTSVGRFGSSSLSGVLGVFEVYKMNSLDLPVNVNGRLKTYGFIGRYTRSVKITA